MIVKFEVINGEYLVVIPQEILNAVNMNERTKLRLKTDGRNIIIEPTHDDKNNIDPKMKKVVEDVMEKYEDVLKKLAE